MLALLSTLNAQPSTGAGLAVYPTHSTLNWCWPCWLPYTLKPNLVLLVQALLSSSIMFSNFMSIYQRRAEAKEKAEQSNRCRSASWHLPYTALPTLKLYSEKGLGGHAMPCYAVLCSAVLCYAVLCCTVLCSNKCTLMCVLYTYINTSAKGTAFLAYLQAPKPPLGLACTRLALYPPG